MCNSYPFFLKRVTITHITYIGALRYLVQNFILIFLILNRFQKSEQNFILFQQFINCCQWNRLDVNCSKVFLAISPKSKFQAPLCIDIENN